MRVAERNFDIDTGSVLSFKLHVGKLRQTADPCDSLQINAFIILSLIPIMKKK